MRKTNKGGGKKTRKSKYVIGLDKKYKKLASQAKTANKMELEKLIAELEKEKSQVGLGKFDSQKRRLLEILKKELTHRISRIKSKRARIVPGGLPGNKR